MKDDKYNEIFEKTLDGFKFTEQDDESEVDSEANKDVEDLEHMINAISWVKRAFTKFGIRDVNLILEKQKNIEAWRKVVSDTPGVDLDDDTTFDALDKLLKLEKEKLEASGGETN